MAQGGGGGGGGTGMVMMMQYPPGAALSPFSPYMPLALPSSVLNGGVGGGGGGVGGGPILLDATNLAQQQQQQMQLQLQLQQLQSQQLQQQQLHQFPPGFGTSLPSGGLINGSDGSKGVGGVGGGGGEGPVATQGFVFGGPTPSFPPCILSSSDTSLSGANIVSSTSSSTSSSSKEVSLDGVNPPSASASTTNTTLAPRSARSASFRRSIFKPQSVSGRDIFSDNGASLNEDDYDDDDREDDSSNVKQVMPLQNPSQPQQQVQPSPRQAPSSSETSVSDLQKRLAALRS
jgi:hypothetical protein